MSKIFVPDIPSYKTIDRFTQTEILNKLKVLCDPHDDEEFISFFNDYSPIISIMQMEKLLDQGFRSSNLSTIRIIINAIREHPHGKDREINMRSMFFGIEIIDLLLDNKVIIYDYRLHRLTHHIYTFLRRAGIINSRLSDGAYISRKYYFQLLCYHQTRKSKVLNKLPKDLIRYLKDFIY